MFCNEACLNVRHPRFIYQHIVQIYLITYWHTPVRPYEWLDCCDRCISHRNNTSARSFLSVTLSRPQANFLHRTCIAGLVKHLSPYTGRILRVNDIWAKSFCPQKMNNRMPFFAGCFQR